MKNILVFVLIFGASFAFADQPTKLVCVSWMGLKTDIQESPIDEYAMAEINFVQGDWSYHADVIEGKLNAINLRYKPLEIETQADADVYPLDHLSTSLMIRETKVTLDCDIRSSNQPVRF